MSEPPPAPLAVCYGTRPQIIKASLLVAALQDQWPLLTVDTGQHYDWELNGVLYEQLGIAPPDVMLDVGSGPAAAQTSLVLERAARVFAHHRPWVAVVIGDTNSTLGAALAAVQSRIPVVHIEAGMRGTDPLMAEEINRRVVDTISAVLCAPSAAAVERLRLEHVGGSIALTGDIAHDVLRRNVANAPPLHAVPGWPLADGTAFTFATLHRAELVDDQSRLADVMTALATLDAPVVFPAHPRTRAALESSGVLARLPAHVHVTAPVGYLHALSCIRDAAVVVTDSGGVQREAYWLGVPCVTVRAETEWRETVRCGANALVRPERAREQLVRVVAVQRTRARVWDRSVYGPGDAAKRIADTVANFAARRGFPGVS